MMDNTREQAIADLKSIIISVKATDIESLVNNNSWYYQWGKFPQKINMQYHNKKCKHMCA